MKKSDFKDRLKYAMDYNHLKAVDLCEKSGVPKSAISYYLSGRSEPKTDRIYILAKALDVSEAWLLGYDVEMARSVEQKENDALAEMYSRVKTEKDFRDTILKISALKPEQFSLIKNLVDALPQE